MSNSKRKREEERRKRERRHERKRSTLVDARFVKADIHREIRFITECAQAEDSRIVSLGDLVLFSTQTRDAWLLETEDHLAICLCREGEPQPFRIIDSPHAFAIEWTASFAIDGTAFIVRERSGRVVELHGYPTVEISAACRRSAPRNDQASRTLDTP